jgi:hypothetical protein
VDIEKLITPESEWLTDDQLAMIVFRGQYGEDIPDSERDHYVRMLGQEWFNEVCLKPALAIREAVLAEHQESVKELMLVADYVLMNLQVFAGHYDSLREMVSEASEELTTHGDDLGVYWGVKFKEWMEAHP